MAGYRASFSGIVRSGGGPAGAALVWKIDEGLSPNSVVNDNTCAIRDVIETKTTFAKSVAVTPRIPFTLGTARKLVNFYGGRPGTASTFRYMAS